MKQESHGLTAETVILQAMARAVLCDDLKALAGHALVYRAVADRAKANT